MINMLNRLENILKCPKTGQNLSYNQIDNCFHVKSEKIHYPVTNNIVDLLARDNDQSNSPEIIRAYDKISIKYDSLITSSNLFSKFIINLTWGGLHEEYIDQVVNYIPNDFEGTILDVPVGTGIYTVEKYSKFKKATILAVDISLEMLKQAQKRYKDKNIDNVIYILADVNSLPFITNSIDFVISMNGFHSFPDKNKSITEINRVLRDNANFAGCFYVSGRRKISDFMVNASLKNTHLFTEPFYSSKEYLEMFGKYFNFMEHKYCRSFFLFNARKY